MIASLGRSLLAGPVRFVHQHAQQPVGQVLEVVQAVAQHRIDVALQAGAHVALHLFDRRLRRQTVADRLVHAPDPATVVGEHAVRLQHVAVLARRRDVVARQHVVDEQPQARDRLVEAVGLVGDVLADQRRHHHPGLVQDGVTEPDAFAQTDAGE